MENSVIILEQTTQTAKEQKDNIIKEYFNRRMELVNNKQFRKDAVEIAKKMGITSEQWNKNKAAILMVIANKFISEMDKVQN